MKTVPVCIVGGGPVGMSLALNLDALGVPSILVNREPDVLHQPRGSTHNSRTLEHYRRLGLSSKLRDLGLPPDQPTDVVYFTRLTGHELSRLAMPSEREKRKARAAAPVTDQIPEPILRCNQRYVEKLVLEHLRTRRNVELRLGWSCIDWTEDDSGVTVKLRGPAGEKEQLRCAYLAGCDGGTSFVRQKLGISYSGSATNTGQAYLSGAMVSTHIRSKEYFSISRHRLGWQNWAINASLRCNMVSLNGVDELILLSQLPDVETRPDEALISQRFLGAVGKPVDFRILGHWRWIPGRALVADSYGRGRVVLAGDSVHLFTPTGGFGMNTGVDDAANLGWKLAALAQGWGGPRLLASYEAERRPIGIRNTGAAKLFSRNIGTLEIPAHIEEDNARGAEARASVNKAMAAFGEEFASIGIQLGARYDGSPIVADEGGDAPRDEPFLYTPNARPGGRAPHLWMQDRSSLFDHFGAGFTLLVLRDAAGIETFAEAAATHRIPLKILPVDVPAARDLYEADLALIRPDQHVAWRGSQPPRDVGALLARVTGH